MRRRPGVAAPGMAAVACLVFASGLSALVYQMVWLRLLRLVFGASTAASAAVLAVFMAGLGLGSLVLGRRVDGHPRPLRFYARLEAGIAMAAAATPFLVALAHSLYVGLGGTPRLGPTTGNVIRLGLAVLVLGLPTFLMGGTLPAVARAVTRSEDGGRRAVAWLYGANTLGAVAGVSLTTFWALELLGIRKTLWAACLLNFLVAAAAGALSRGWAQGRSQATNRKRGNAVSQVAGQGSAPGDSVGARGSRLLRGFVLVAAAVVGFAFLLLELVWYRMLSPVLGGSSYTFGLILAVALLGVGVGGLLYAVTFRHRRPSLATFAMTCALEAVLVVLPFALGDRLAVVAMLLRPWGDLNFALLVGGWFLFTAVVVLPAALLAGYQFPLLVALLGSGPERIGGQVGLAYAWNTGGAILGSLAGGFGLIPWLSAPGTWRAVVVLLVCLAALAALAAVTTAAGAARAGERRGLRRLSASAGVGARTAAAASLLTLVALGLLAAPGPSAVWRHTPTGAGGMPRSFGGPNDLRSMMQDVRRAFVWERDGVESSVAVHGLSEISFFLNGKADGSALKDAPTQVMSGLVGAVLHPEPRRALVIGLGTGSSAGWLAEVPSVERVDVVEIEPAILHVARLCAPVNRNALENPKVRVYIGDGREHLLVGTESYDLIFSEPSNPYRAGISSLYSREFYQAAARRLDGDGLFLQWLQGYDVDSQVVRTVLATLGSVFPHLESWQVHDNDLLLVASRRRIVHDLDEVDRRVAAEPLRSALVHVLGVEGATGFYTGFVASQALATAVRREEGGDINTDDHPRVEFGFARSLGRDLEFTIDRLSDLARARGEAHPRFEGRDPDWRRVLELRSARNVRWGLKTSYPPSGNPDFDARVRSRNAYVGGDLAAARSHWLSQPGEPASPMDRILVAEVLAEGGDPRAAEHGQGLWAAGHGMEAAAVLARFHHAQGDAAAAVRHLLFAFGRARENPWSYRPVLHRALLLASRLSQEEPGFATDLFHGLEEPFAVRLLDELRLRVRLEIAQSADFTALCRRALAPFEPHVPWEEGFLVLRQRCYRATGHALSQEAQADLGRFLTDRPPKLDGRATAEPVGEAEPENPRQVDLKHPDVP